MKADLKLGLFLHSNLDFIGIVATCIFGDRCLLYSVVPIPEISIFPPFSFPAHPTGGKQAGRTKSFIRKGWSTFKTAKSWGFSWGLYRLKILDCIKSLNFRATLWRQNSTSHFSGQFPPFRNNAHFSQHVFREFRCCEKGYLRCINYIYYKWMRTVPWQEAPGHVSLCWFI